ncbi:MAG TPA: AraC family transcriptional regulator [Salinarimonas sp.]|nr:AraC family transcriptional regulator [Salinarimonas sp.]
MLERHQRREWTPPGASIGLKPAGLQHENRWGRDGVLIFSLKLRDAGWEELFPTDEPGWSATGDTYLGPALFGRLAQAPDAARRQETIFDLLALPLIRKERSRTSVPAWLSRAREAIRDEPEIVRIDAAAREAGVHRVRFTALFKAAFGLPPSLYRHRVMTARAIARIAGGTGPLTRVAHETGFADQSHLTRSVSRSTGLSPSRLRALLA